MNSAKITGINEIRKTSGTASTPPPMVEVSKRKSTIPSGNGTTPKIMPTTPVNRIPAIMPPLKPRATRASVSTSPNTASNTGPCVKSPSFRYVTGSATTIPPFFRPIKAMNSPMPTAMANFRLRGMALSTASRRLVRTNSVTSRPSTTTTAIACCQERPMPSISVNATMAFSPRPEARATG